MSRVTPAHVLKAIVDGINTGDLDALVFFMSRAPLLRLNLVARYMAQRVSASHSPEPGQTARQ